MGTQKIILDDGERFWIKEQNYFEINSNEKMQLTILSWRKGRLENAFIFKIY